VAAEWEPGEAVIREACRAGASSAQGVGFLAGWWMGLSCARPVPVPVGRSSSCCSQSWSRAGPDGLGSYEGQGSGLPMCRWGSGGPEGL
jgi:hypothetical protein